MKKDIIDQIIEVRMKRNVLRKRKEELQILREKIRNDMAEIEQQILTLELDEESLKEQYRKEHTREFYSPMDEVDICQRIRSDGSIRGMKF